MGWAIALHGGGGDIPGSMPLERRQPREEALPHCLQIGVKALHVNMPPLDVVELVVRELENIPHFNAGRGSVLTTKGTVEVEASIMDGNKKRCGAVSGLTAVVNAFSLARLVMENTPHIYLAFDGAEEFAREQSVETLDSSHFITAENVEDYSWQTKPIGSRLIIMSNPSKMVLRRKHHVANGDSQTGAVGCVAVDTHGILASATSTGGLVNKMVGQIGDSPIIGAGTYELCAVSAAGQGEAIIRGTVASDVAALMNFKGLSLKEAADCVIHERTPKGTVGLVSVSAAGEVAMPFSTASMFRACATEDGHSQIAIWPSD